jgi:WD40 repeat protein
VGGPTRLTRHALASAGGNWPDSGSRSMARRLGWSLVLLLSALLLYGLGVWLLPSGSPRIGVPPRELPSEPFGGLVNDAWGIAFSPNGDVLATAGSDCQVRLWNLDGSPHGPALQGHEAPVLSVAFCPKGDLLASGGGDSTIQLWKLDGSAVGDPFKLTHAIARSLNFSPSGDCLLSAGGDVILWNLDGTIRGRAIRANAYAAVFVQSKDGLLVATAGEDQIIRLWNLNGQQHGKPMEGHSDEIMSVATSPNGDLVASASRDGTVRLWNLDGSAHGKPCRGHKGAVYAVAFSPGGDVLASGGGDSTVRLWNLDGSSRGQPLQCDQRGLIVSVAFSPAGDLLASGSNAGVRVWDIKRGRLAVPDAPLLSPDKPGSRTDK